MCVPHGSRAVCGRPNGPLPASPGPRADITARPGRPGRSGRAGSVVTGARGRMLPGYPGGPRLSVRADCTSGRGFAPPGTLGCVGPVRCELAPNRDALGWVVAGRTAGVGVGRGDRMVLGGRAPLADGTGLSVLGPGATLAWLWVKSTSRGSISRGVLRPEVSGILRLALFVRAAVAEGGLRWSTCSRTESLRGKSGVGRRPRSNRGEGRGATPWAARRSATSRRTSSAARELGPSPLPLPGVRSS
mmetsp:Transcript_88131/g.201455  ORF Transcript_88131/g.201455 Transcript_88131/m.201455 type:complete len:246 (-) Transcript_88131:1568-2305(-)